MRKYAKVELEWMDACSESVWCTLDSVPKIARVVTKGFLIAEDEDSITICGSISPAADDKEGDTFGDCISIPKQWARKKKRVRQ